MNGVLVHLLSAASGVMVALLAVTRGRGSRLALPLTLLGANGFAWNASSMGLELTHDVAYAWLGAVAAPPYVAIIFHTIVLFVGERRRLGWLMWTGYGLCGVQSVVAAISFVPSASVELATVSTVLLLGSLPLAVVAFWLLARHLSGAVGAVERARTRVFLLALAAASVLLVTDPLADLGLAIPRLATFGGLVFNVLMTYLALGLELFPRAPAVLTAVAQAVALALLVVAVYVAVFTEFRDEAGLLLASGVAATVVVATVGTLLVLRAQKVRAEQSHFATLGRFSAQMAHDLRNPLAAARGAAEFLAVEVQRDGQRERHELATLLVDQLDRLATVIDRYQRLSSMTIEPTRFDLNQLVEKVLKVQPFAHGASAVTLLHSPWPAPLPVRADQDLLRSVVENLVKNACEAMPRGGTLTVTTRLDPTHAHLLIHDTGVGMDPRTREQAFELFFTTKASGSGLGLAFARAVMHAHGGEVVLTSKEGSYTLVELVLPVHLLNGG